MVKRAPEREDIDAISSAHTAHRRPAPTVLALPFRDTWLVENSPARRVPSHGTHLFASTYAIDFVAVEDGRARSAVDRGTATGDRTVSDAPDWRTAAVRDWRTAFATEPADRFYAFGRPILAPVDGRVIAVHDGEIDHEARRSQLTLAHYALTQASRARLGAGGLAGNHVILALSDVGPYVVLAHLRRGSITVRPKEPVVTGQALGECGNSGNSTQPHVHVQVMDSPDPLSARGVPMAFRDFRLWPHGALQQRTVEQGLPGERDVVAAFAPTSPETW